MTGAGNVSSGLAVWEDRAPGVKDRKNLVIVIDVEL